MKNWSSTQKKVAWVLVVVGLIFVRAGVKAWARDEHRTSSSKSVVDKEAIRRDIDEALKKHKVTHPRGEN